MDSMQTFGSWQIILLENDKVGNDGDVLTRVGANDAKFKPGGGGSSAWGDITGTLANQTDLQAALDAVTFDQPLNTTDDVVFASVYAYSLTSLEVINFKDALGVLKGGQILSTGLALRGRTFADAEIDLLTWDNSNDRLVLGHTANSKTSLRGGELELIAGVSSEVYIVAHATNGLLIETTGLPINLAPGGDLNINGTPGVTEQIVIAGVGTLDLTKGLATGWTPV